MPWKYVSVLVPIKNKINAGVASPAVVQCQASFPAVEEELTLLGAQVCGVCSGAGHKAKNCPTKGKLTAISHGGTVAARLIGMLHKYADGNEVMLPTVPFQRSTLRVNGGAVIRRRDRPRRRGN